MGVLAILVRLVIAALASCAVLFCYMAALSSFGSKIFDEMRGKEKSFLSVMWGFGTLSLFLASLLIKIDWPL